MDALELSSFCSEYVAANVKKSTLIQIRTQTGHLARYLQAQNGKAYKPTTADLCATTIEAAASWLAGHPLPGRRPWAHDTVAKFKRTIRAIWERANQLGFAEPAVKLSKPPRVKHERASWTKEELAKLFGGVSLLPGQIGDHAAAVWCEAYLRWIYNAGARHDESMKLCRSDFDLEARICRIPGRCRKNGKTHRVRLWPGTVDALRKIWGPERDAEVFADWTWDRGGDGWPAQDRLLRKVIVLAGLRGSVDLANAVAAGGFKPGAGRELQTELKAAVPSVDLFHKLRRSRATHYYIQTGDLERVKRLLDHSDLSVTRGYIDWGQVDAAQDGDDDSDDPVPRSIESPRLFDLEEDAA